MSYKVFKVGDIIHFNNGILGGDIAKAKIISIEVGIFNDNMYVIENCYDGITTIVSEAFMQEFAELLWNSKTPDDIPERSEIENEKDSM